MITCEHCGIRVLLTEYGWHLEDDHGIPQSWRECETCGGQGEMPRRHYHADGDTCTRCHGRGVL